MASFQNKWTPGNDSGLVSKISDTVKPKGALKPRVQGAIARIQKQGAKLDGMLTKLQERDSVVFQKVVDATQRHDTSGARVLSCELSEIRKVSRVLGNARMALQQVELRLTTAHDVGDTIVAIMPTIGVMGSMKSSLAKFMPGADQEISKMSEMLGGMMGETFSDSGAFASDATMNAEAERILNEASAVAETNSDTKFPSTPTDTGVSSSEIPAPKFL